MTTTMSTVENADAESFRVNSLYRNADSDQMAADAHPLEYASAPARRRNWRCVVILSLVILVALIFIWGWNRPQRLYRERIWPTPTPNM